MTYVIFLWMANLYPQEVIQQPVNRFVLVEHYEELYNQWQVFRPEHLTWRKIQTSSNNSFKEVPVGGIFLISQMLCH